MAGAHRGEFMRNAFTRCLLEMMDKEEQYLLTGDLGFGAFEAIREKHPNYFFNMGLAEQNMIGTAAGLATAGKIVFTYSIIPFIAYRAFEQIRDDVCYPCLPVRLVGIGAGFAYSNEGPTHHAYEDVTVLSTLPNLAILCPSDPKEMEFFMHAIPNIKGPCYLRLSRNNDPDLHNKHADMRVGKLLELMKGEDILL